MLLTTDSTPDGIYVTFPTALLFGLGFQAVTSIVGLLLLFTIEFPIRRLLQHLILPLISHDKLLKAHYMDGQNKLRE